MHFVRIHKQAKYQKLTPLVFDFSYTGKQRLRRWQPALACKPNAIALEDLRPGDFVTVDGNGHTILAEIRNHRAPDPWPFPSKYSH